MSCVEEMILGLLHFRPQSSYDVKTSLQKLASHYFSASFGSIHPALRRLEARREIVSRADSKSPRKRKLHSLTQVGRVRFETWIRSAPSLERGDEELLARVFFLGLVPVGERRKLLLGVAQALEEAKERLLRLRHEALEQVAAAQIPEALRDVPLYQVATIDFGVGHFDLAEKWIQSLAAEASP